MEDRPVLYTVKEVSKLIQTNTSFVYKLIHEGHLPAIKIGSVKVRKEALDNFLKELESGSRAVN